MSTYRYYAWSTGETVNGKALIKGNKLLSKERRIMLFEDLKDLQVDMYQTIQGYDEFGQSPECPIYADFDGPCAINDTRDFVHTLYKKFRVYPNIYYSGSKGFHVVLDCIIEHEQCHSIVKYIVQSLGKWPTLDLTVYTSRRLWRIPGSFNIKGNRYKIPLYPSSLFTLSTDEINHFAKTKPSRYELDMWQDFNFNIDLLTTLIAEFLSMKKPCKEIPAIEPISDNWKETIPPCLYEMLRNEPENGVWNTTICALARFFKYIKVDIGEAVSIMFEHPHYANDVPHVVAVFDAVYKSSNCSFVGCRTGQASSIMQKFCGNLCCYNKDPLVFSTKNKP